MFDKVSHSHTVTAADQELAAQYVTRPAALPVALETDDIVAAANSGNRITIGNGASIDVQPQEPTRSVMLGNADSARAVVDTQLEGMARQADFHIERMNMLLDRETGEPRPEYLGEYNRHALAVRQLQASAAYQQVFAVKALRAKADAAATASREQAHREAEAHERRAQNAAAREFDAIFGRTSIR